MGYEMHLYQGNTLKRKSRFMRKSIEEIKPQRFSASVYVPEDSWTPVKLTNDDRKLSFVINERMTCADIVREVLQDDTPPSNLSKLLKGACKRINGWRCEYLD
jgi:hypothetical protein